MRPGLIVAGMVVALLATPAAASPLRDTAVGVGEREFTLTPYRRSAPRGIVRFNVTNYGEDTHDLTVLDRKGRTVAHSPEIRAGARSALRAKLKRPGVYRLLCTVADHAARGMRARIRIVSR